MTSPWMVLVTALLASAGAAGTGALLWRRGLLRVAPLRYVPHLVFLYIVAAVPLLTRGGVSALHIASVFAGVAAIWLVALLLLSRVRV